ncbi:MAG: hypothetical protein AAF846_11335 [Chloroflexota bacterium]
MKNNISERNIYIIGALIILFLGIWGYRALVQEFFYYTRYNLLPLLAVCGVTILSILIGFVIFGVFIAYSHEKTNSYLLVLIEFIIIICAFQLPTQPAPEVRHFHRYREDYDLIIDLIAEGQLTVDSGQFCNHTYRQSVETTINGRVYCVGLSEYGALISVFNEQVAMLYSPNYSDEVACNSVSLYDEKLIHLDITDWNLCMSFAW